MLVASICTMVLRSIDKIFVGELSQYCFLAHNPAELWPRLIKVLLVQFFWPIANFVYEWAAAAVSLSSALAIRQQAFPFALRNSACDAGYLKEVLDVEVSGLTSMISSVFQAVLGVLVYGTFVSRLLLRQKHPGLQRVLFMLFVTVSVGVVGAMWMARAKITPLTDKEKDVRRSVATTLNAEMDFADETRAYDVIDERSETLNTGFRDVGNASLRAAVWTQGWRMMDAWRQNAVFFVIYYMVGSLVMDKSVGFGVYHALFGLALNFAMSLKGCLEGFTRVDQARKTWRDINKLCVPDEHKPHVGARAAAQTHDLTVKNLTVTESKKAVVQDVSFELRRGQVTALVGASGAGKSSLLRFLAGLSVTTSGSARFGGKELVDFRDKAEAIAWLPQAPGLLPGSIQDNIVLHKEVDEGRLHDCLKQAAASELESRLNEDALGTKKNERRSKLSGGEKQRLALARVLYREPVVMLLDEPTSALDAKAERVVFDNLREIAETKNVAILMVTHKLTLSEQAHNLLVMANGTIVQEGDHKTLSEDVSGAYSQLVQQARI
eukprot:TRINITY_DN11496_c0_g1_i2.p1 TRINITY_DN11496_c0_g1~~TRINITY_DN11496_c0_g1_i2.p1  ORF type:complete len:551 (+),score=86.56 TRINITY_DN11496_c0_g1_i2:498-2150(+)